VFKAVKGVQTTINHPYLLPSSTTISTILLTWKMANEMMLYVELELMLVGLLILDHIKSSVDELDASLPV